jgi:CsoR family transcriptional regulator, copper-sensing transcriptional repressor
MVKDKAEIHESRPHGNGELSDAAEHAKNHVHSHQQRKAITNRLSRIEGHIRSIKAMVEEGRDCPEILHQIAAVKSAIDQTGRVVLEDHLESCLFHVGVSPEVNEVWLGVKESLDAIF